MTKDSGVYFYKKVVKIPMYSGYFIIVFSNDVRAVEKTVNLQNNHLDYLYAHTFHNFIYGGYESFCITLNFWSNTSTISLGSITHELTHCVNRVLQARGVVLDWENDEASAYLSSWMGDEVQKFMKQCNLKIW